MTKKEQYQIALEHARGFGLEREFKQAYRFWGNSVFKALEDWDLLTDEIVEKLTTE